MPITQDAHSSAWKSGVGLHAISGDCQRCISQPAPQPRNCRKPHGTSTLSLQLSQSVPTQAPGQAVGSSSTDPQLHNNNDNDKVCLRVAVECRWMHMNRERVGWDGGVMRDLGKSIDYLFIFVSEWTNGNWCAHLSLCNIVIV